MEQAIFLLAFVAVLGTLYFQRWLLEAILEAIQNFRGGPPRPGHPLPAEDGTMLRRRLKPKP